jgi:hypothetical protein
VSEIKNLKLRITAGDYTDVYVTEDPQRVAAILSMLLNEDADIEDEMTPEERESRNLDAIHKKIQDVTDNVDGRFYDLTNRIQKLTDSLYPQKESV